MHACPPVNQNLARRSGRLAKRQKLSAMPAALAPAGTPALGAAMIPVSAPGARALRATVISASSAGVCAFRAARAVVATASLRPPWAAQALEPATRLWPAPPGLGGFAAFLPHLEHMLRRPGLAPTALRGGHALFHHLAGELRRAALWSTALAALGHSTFLGCHCPFFHGGNSVGRDTLAIMAALGVFAPFLRAMPTILIRHHGGGHSRPKQESGRHSNNLA